MIRRRIGNPLSPLAWTLLAYAAAGAGLFIAAHLR